MNKLNKNFSIYVDKLQAKRIVKHMCGNKIKVPRTVRLLKNYEDITEDDLNTNYIIKAAHSSGCNVVITPYIKNNVSYIKNRLKKHNRIYIGKNEIQYSYLKPTFFVEEIIDDKQFGKNGNAITYMLRCIHGIPYTMTLLDKKKNMQQHYLFNENKTLKLVQMNYEELHQLKFNYHIDVPKQNLIDKMYNLASTLSKPFEFVRIDFYIGKDDDIYFSEFTFTPGCGWRNFSMDVEIKLGKYWT
jgi:hypothetical protein